MLQSWVFPERTKFVKSAIVVGTGAGGATVAKELQGTFDVTILEAGREFRPFTMDLQPVRRFKAMGMMFDEREIELLFPAMRIRKTRERMVLVRGIATGGTTTIATGNGLRMEQQLKEVGIDLSAEYAELEGEVPLSTEHQRRWRPATRKLFEMFNELGHNPKPTPKMGDHRKCIRCGRCVLGCQQGAKWDSRCFLDVALDRGARLIPRCKAEQVVFKGSNAVGVKARRGWGAEYYYADLIVLAAGGFGTPVILQNSGIECERTLFVDPVLCVAAEWKNCLQNKEIAMPFVVQKDGFIVSPYFDYLSYFFRKDWVNAPEDTLGLMIKIADTNLGSISSGTVEKVLTDRDSRRFQEGVDLCAEVLGQLGVDPSRIVLGTLNAGHPGGMLPLKGAGKTDFHSSSLPENLYVADATLLPQALGNPPIFTIMAMAKRVSRICKNLA